MVLISPRIHANSNPTQLTVSTPARTALWAVPHTLRAIAIIEKKAPGPGNPTMTAMTIWGASETGEGANHGSWTLTRCWHSFAWVPNVRKQPRSERFRTLRWVTLCWSSLATAGFCPWSQSRHRLKQHHLGWKATTTSPAIPQPLAMAGATPASPEPQALHGGAILTSLTNDRDGKGPLAPA